MNDKEIAKEWFGKFREEYAYKKEVLQLMQEARADTIRKAVDGVKEIRIYTTAEEGGFCRHPADVKKDVLDLLEKLKNAPGGEREGTPWLTTGTPNSIKLKQPKGVER